MCFGEMGGGNVHSLVSLCHDAPEDTPEEGLVLVREEVDAVGGDEGEIEKPALEVFAIPKNEFVEGGPVVEVEGACNP